MTDSEKAPPLQNRCDSESCAIPDKEQYDDLRVRYNIIQGLLIEVLKDAVRKVIPRTHS